MLMHDDKSRPADSRTIEAVRRVIRDWDGLNYEAVRQALVGADWPAAEVDRILATPGALRQAFAVGQRRIAVKLGGCPQTTDATIVSLNLSAEDASRWAQGGEKAQGAGAPATFADGITTTEAACILRLDPKHVARLVSDGAIVGHKSGGTWCISRASVEAYQKRPQAQAAPSRIGISYCCDSCGETMTTRDTPPTCPKCNSRNWTPLPKRRPPARGCATGRNPW
jgi:excisionase family DNA binding protein